MSSAPGAFPEPPVPLDCDLRGYEFMPLYGTHLFGSEFNARASDTAWRAAITLWWAAWNQQPAASLPSDDVALCRLADLGRDMKTWAKIKDDALHGFVVCSDGRLYHMFLGKLALEAWDRRLKDRARKQSWRDKKDGDGTASETGTRHGRNADVPRTKTGTTDHVPVPSASQNADVPADRRGQDRRGQEVGRATPSPPTPRDLLGKELRRRGMSTAPQAIEEWSDFLQGACKIKDTGETGLALDLILDHAKRDGVVITYSKHAAAYADRVKFSLKQERKP